jgi:hypothetical protein
MRFKPNCPSCSNCGCRERLHLVTCAGPGADEPGRTLVYCNQCRADKPLMIDVSIPIGLLTEELLIGLYATGKTTSDPNTVVGLILGLEDTSITEKLRRTK